MKVLQPVNRFCSLLHSEAIGVFFIFMGALVLRLFRLTHPTFWIDEIGVWEAAVQPSWQEAIGIAKGHIMGMPLHYLQTWLAGKIGLQNEWLRLPDAIWGSLTILVGYRLARHYLEKPAAVLTVALMATSPLLIRYSQELRFYAGLSFFYLLLILSAFQALEKGKWYRWLAVTLLGMTGILFHVYAISGLIFAYIAVFTTPHRRSTQNLRSLLIVTIFLLVFFGWAVVQFGSVPGYSTPLFAFENPTEFVLRGLGFAPLYSPKMTTLFYYGAIGFVFTVGIATAIQNRNHHLIYPILTSILILAIIFGMNWYRHYFVHSRQIYFLSFWVYVLSAQGVYAVFQWLSQRLSALREKPSRWIVGGMVIAGIFCCLPALSQYYTAERTIVRSGYAPLLEHWQAGDWICVIPDFDVAVYKFYWKDDLGAWLLPCDPQDVSQNPPIQFVIANEDLDFSPVFREIFRPPRDTFYPKRIWMRSD